MASLGCIIDARALLRGSAAISPSIRVSVESDLRARADGRLTRQIVRV
jgi:hypothetical protein